MNSVTLALRANVANDDAIMTKSTENPLEAIRIAAKLIARILSNVSKELASKLSDVIVNLLNSDKNIVMVQDSKIDNKMSEEKMSTDKLIEEEKKREALLRQWEESGEVILPNGVKAEYIVDQGVLELIVLTDEEGNEMEVPPALFDLSLLEPGIKP